ncbi:MAG: c-type cytochrome [Methylocystaceae bacterium]|nr:c-type cytochrome [Methylocystaceae bacterium]
MRSFALIFLIGGITLTGCIPNESAISANAQRGKKLFQKQCATCHSMGESTYDKRGPDLANLFGRKTGSNTDYQHYSPALRDLSLGWTPQLLEDYLNHPSAFLRKHLNDQSAQSRMNVRVKTDQDRKDITAFLKEVL